MSDQASKDAAAKQRIISHMNADHHDSIIRYLEHYSKLPSYRAYEGKLEDITLEKMTFRCNGSSFEIPFKPLMQSYRDARERVVEMDKECLSALDKSEITVKEYIPPTGFHALGSLAVIATLIGFSTRIWFAPGGQVDRISPGFASFCFTVQPVLITLGLAIHSAEMIYMIRGRLRRHSVNVRTSLWWKWALGTFIEGFGSDLRFDALVKRKQAEKEKQKH